MVTWFYYFVVALYCGDLTHHGRSVYVVEEVCSQHGDQEAKGEIGRFPIPDITFKEVI